MAHKIWLGAVAAASLLLIGCAAMAAEPSATPEASHTMPDGTVMPGSEHEGHGGATAGASGEHDGEHASAAGDAHDSEHGPSEAARMICDGQVVTSVASILQLEGDVTPSSAWEAPTFSCTYDIDGEPLVLTVHDVTDAAAGREHFDALQEDLGAEEIEGMLGLGLPSFSTGDGVVAFLRDGKTLTVDATALPDGFAGDATTHDEAAYAIASAVLTCWVEHD